MGPVDRMVITNAPACEKWNLTVSAAAKTVGFHASCPQTPFGGHSIWIETLSRHGGGVPSGGFFALARTAGPPEDTPALPKLEFETVLPPANSPSGLHGFRAHQTHLGTPFGSETPSRMKGVSLPGRFSAGLVRKAPPNTPTPRLPK